MCSSRSIRCWPARSSSRGSEATKRSRRRPPPLSLDCFVASLPRNDGEALFRNGRMRGHRRAAVKRMRRAATMRSSRSIRSWPARSSSRGSEATKRSRRRPPPLSLDCFVASLPRNDGEALFKDGLLRGAAAPHSRRPQARAPASSTPIQRSSRALASMGVCRTLIVLCGQSEERRPRRSFQRSDCNMAAPRAAGSTPQQAMS